MNYSNKKSDKKRVSESEAEYLRQENEVLRNTISRLEQLFRNTTIGMYQTTPDGLVIQANEPLIKMLGYDSFEDLKQHNLEDDELITSRDRVIFKEKIEKDGFIIGHETQWLRKNGEEIFIRESARAIKDESGKIIFYEGTVEDITSRKLKETELIESEEKYRKLVELMPNGVVIHKDNIIVYANEAIAKIIKTKSYKNLIGQNIFKYIHKDYYKLITFRLKQSLEGKAIAELTEEIFLTETGSEIPVEVCTVPFEMNGDTHFLTVVTDITERRLAEKEIKLSEITYRGMLNSVSEAIFIQDIEGIFIDVNKTAEYFYGYEHNFFIGRSPSDLSADNLNNIKKIKQQIVAAYNGKPQIFEFWGKKSDNTVFPTEVSLVSGLYFGKKVVLAVVRDISERIISEQKLIESERKYRNLIDFAVGGILLGNYEGYILEANSYICTLMGRSREEIIGKHISDGFFTEESLKKSPLLFEKLKNGLSVINEREIVRPDGTIVPIEMHTKMMPDKTYQTIYHDISERKLKDSQILEAKDLAEKLHLNKEALLKAMPDILFTFNKDGQIIDFYSNFRNVYFSHPEQFMNKNVNEVLPPFLAEITQKNINKVLSGKDMAKYTYELEINERTLHFDARMVYLNQDTVLAVVRDITERMMLISDLNKAKIKAEESDRLKSAFLANMSHEIRTPMNGILGFTDLLKDDVTNEEKHEYLEIIENSCNQLLMILNDIMEISKIEAGIVNKKIESIVINDFIQNIFTEMQGLVPKDRNIKLILSANIPAKKIIGLSDTVKLKQVITNLINNALKFTEEGSVELGYNLLSDSFIEFYVSDTGLGISKNDIDKIFNRFVQIDNKLSVQNSGSGLGLSICKAYSEILGGNISVESEEGKGSRFILTIPLITYS